jgi:ABC-type nitrate/sulfonate/bicarbonate transport system substrate-binding protein
MSSGLHSGRRFARARWLAVVAALVLSAANQPTSASAQQLTPIRVTNFQNTVVLGLYHGIDKGYFKEAGLDLQIVRVATGAASVSAVASSQADIGWAATTVPIFARSNGVNVKAFMTADQEGPPDHYGVFIDASAKSGVNSFADLKGKTVMINAFGTAGELAIRDRLQKAGISWDDVKKITVPFPQMQAALELGNADVAITIQPMHASIMANKAIGAKVLDVGTLSDSRTKAATASVYFATDEWLAKNEKLALAFGRAFLRAQKEVHADPKLRLELVMKIAGMDEATAKTVPEAWFETLAITKEATVTAYDTLIRTGMMTKTFPVEDVIATLPF